MTSTEPESRRDYVARREELASDLRRLHRAIPGPMSGFGSLHAAAMTDGALNAVTKELIALAVGITSHCEGCVAYHVHAALEAGAGRAEIEETIGVAVMMGGGPATVYGADAVAALDQFEAEIA